jgi:hypothetical protein
MNGKTCPIQQALAWFYIATNHELDTDEVKLINSVIYPEAKKRLDEMKERK